MNVNSSNNSNAHIHIVLIFIFLFLTACSTFEYSPSRQSELKQIDAVLAQAEYNAIAQQIEPLFAIDHSRLAEKSGEVLDASKVQFYTNPKLNSQLLQSHIRAGLDLPYRIQAYYQKGELNVRYTDVEYLKIRHGIKDSKLQTQIDMEIKNLMNLIIRQQQILPPII